MSWKEKYTIHAVGKDSLQHQELWSTVELPDTLSVVRTWIAYGKAITGKKK